MTISALYAGWIGAALSVGGPGTWDDSGWQGAEPLPATEAHTVYGPFGLFPNVLPRLNPPHIRGGPQRSPVCVGPGCQPHSQGPQSNQPPRWGSSGADSYVAPADTPSVYAPGSQYAQQLEQIESSLAGRLEQLEQQSQQHASAIATLDDHAGQLEANLAAAQKRFDDAARAADEVLGIVNAQEKRAQQEAQSKLEQLRQELTAQMAALSRGNTAYEGETGENLLWAILPAVLGAGGASGVGLLWAVAMWIAGRRRRRIRRRGPPRGEPIRHAPPVQQQTTTAGDEGAPAPRPFHQKRPEPLTVHTPPPPQCKVPEVRYAPYETNEYAQAHAWARQQLSGKYPKSVEYLETLEQLIKQWLSAHGQPTAM